MVKSHDSGRLVTGLGIPIPRQFCPEVQVADVLILDRHTVEAEVAEAVQTCALKVWDWTIVPLPTPAPSTRKITGTQRVSRH